jgi:hypothetical protein
MSNQIEIRDLRSEDIRFKNKCQLMIQSTMVQKIKEHLVDPNVNTNVHYNIHSGSVLMSHFKEKYFKKLAAFICA